MIVARVGNRGKAKPAARQLAVVQPTAQGLTKGLLMGRAAATCPGQADGPASKALPEFLVKSLKKGLLPVHAFGVGR